MKNKENTYFSCFNNIKEGKVETAYLLTGENDFLKSSFLNSIEPLFINPAFTSMDELVTYGDTFTTDMLSWLWLIPMASKKKVLIIKEAEHIQKELIQKIQDYIDKPADTGVLFLLVGDSKKENLFKNVKIIKFGGLHDRGTKSWIKDFLNKKGVTIEDRGGELLQELFSNDLQLIRTELDKLISFVSPSNFIKAVDVEAMESYELEGSIFNLMDAIGTKNFTKSIHFLNLLLTLKDSSGGEKASKILWMINQHFDRLHKIKHGNTNFSKSTYYLDKLSKQAKLWREEDLIETFKKLFEVEFAFKSGKAEIGFLLNKLVYNLCS